MTSPKGVVCREGVSSQCLSLSLSVFLDLEIGKLLVPLLLVAFLFLVVRPGAPSSVLAPISGRQGRLLIQKSTPLPMGGGVMGLIKSLH